MLQKLYWKKITIWGNEPIKLREYLLSVIFELSDLRVVVVGAFVVGQLEFAEGDFLPHPVSAGVGRFRVHVHFVT